MSQVQSQRPQSEAARPQQPAREPMRVGAWGIELHDTSDLLRFAEYWVASKANSTRREANRLTVADAIVSLQAGAELGLTPVQSLNGIMIVNGVTSAWGDVLLGICLRSPSFDHGAFQEWSEGSVEDGSFVAHCKVSRIGGEAHVRRFGMAEAKRAKLAGKEGPWQNYPDRMCQLRARAFALRDRFGDLLRGMYSVEEARDISVDRLLDQIDIGPSGIRPPKEKPRPAVAPPVPSAPSTPEPVVDAPDEPTPEPESDESPVDVVPDDVAAILAALAPFGKTLADCEEKVSASCGNWNEDDYATLRLWPKSLGKTRAQRISQST